MVWILVDTPTQGRLLSGDEMQARQGKQVGEPENRVFVVVVTTCVPPLGTSSPSCSALVLTGAFSMIHEQAYEGTCTPASTQPRI